MQPDYLLSEIDSELAQISNFLDEAPAFSDQHWWPDLIVREYLPNSAIAPTLVVNRFVDTILINLSGVIQISYRHGRDRFTAALTQGCTGIFPKGNDFTCGRPTSAHVMTIYIPHEAIIRSAMAMRISDPKRIQLKLEFCVSDGIIQEISRELLIELHVGNPSGDIYAKTLNRALIMHLVRHHSNAFAKLDLPYHPFGNREIHQAIDYINNNLDHSITLPELAHSVNVSVSHFAHSFRRKTGISPHQYIIHQRVKKAKGLLTTRNLTIAEIAQLVGFADHSHLTRCFKRICGVTPKEFQKNKNIQEND